MPDRVLGRRRAKHATRPASSPGATSPDPQDGRAGLFGLAHVAAVAFLAARVAPAGAYWVALAGGVALARAAQRFGARAGYGSSAAAMLETVAIIGPARFSGPLTQALTAPMLGRLEARGVGPVAQAAACGLVRLAHNAALTAFFIWVIVGGLDAYAGTYDRAAELLPAWPEGAGGALALTAAGLLAWAVFASAVQVLVYRRGLRAWPPEADRAPREDPASPPAGEPPAGGRADPRAIAAATAIAFVLLLAGTGWALLAAVAASLLAASLLTGLDRTVLPAGAVLAGLLGASALLFGLLGGLGLDLAARRALRALLLVAAATWLRAAAGGDGVREVAHRTLGRLRALPGAPEAAQVLARLGSDRRLVPAGRSLARSLRGVRRRPLPFLDAVLRWVAGEAGRFTLAPPAPRARLRARPVDGLVVALAALPAVAV